MMPMCSHSSCWDCMLDGVGSFTISPPISRSYGECNAGDWGSALCFNHHPPDATRDLAAPLSTTCGGRAHGAQQLSATVAHLHHDLLELRPRPLRQGQTVAWPAPHNRSGEHTSELQSRGHLVCRLLLEKKK